MRVVILFLFALGVAVALEAAPVAPRIPLADHVTGYKWCIKNLINFRVFEPRELSKEKGDALLKLLDEGRVVGAKKYPRDVAVKLAPARLWIFATLGDGTTYQFGISNDGSLDLPAGRYEINEATLPKVKQWVTDLNADLRREVLNTPRPCSYRMWTLDDGGTLSGVARIFYGDASKWTVIYEANKAIIKNPNLVPIDAVLTIP